MGAALDRLPTHETMVDNIIRLWGESDTYAHESGTSWYDVALGHAQDMATEYNVDLWQAVAIIASLSPQTEWTRNLDEARELLSRWTMGLEITPRNIGTTQDRLNRCFLALANDTSDIARVKGTRKVASFFRAILGDPDAVTVDRHAYRVALGDPTLDAPGKITDAVYRAIAAAYREAATHIGEEPRVLQAITWTHVVETRLGLAEATRQTVQEPL